MTNDAQPSKSEQRWTEGREVIYRHVSRGGYGYMSFIPATVVKVGPKRVRIRMSVGGRDHETWVNPENLGEPSARR